MAGELWLIAGPNGSGKTTLADSFVFGEMLADVQRLNPDALTRSRLQRLGYRGFADAPPEIQLREFQSAAVDVEAAIEAMIRVEARIAVETVLSTAKYRPLVEAVLSLGGEVRMVYVILKSPDINVQRVAHRVASGGHNVPENKIRERWVRSLGQLPWFASRCHEFWVFDNTDSTPGAELGHVAHGVSGRLVEVNAPFPELAHALHQIISAIAPLD
jgi:predicted ABC-type ATPase